ncbi:MAG: PhoX family protein, partial [Rubrivivax sp.]
MAKDFSTMEDSNRSSNRSIHDVSDPARRTVLRGGLGALATGLLAPLAGPAFAQGASGSSRLLGFQSVAVSTADQVTVPPGYTVQVIAAWGDPVGLSGETTPFRFDGSNSATEQETQFGMHHDGLHFFRHPLTPENPQTGLLVMNHEYTDDGLLHRDGMTTWTADKVRKAQAAHGVSVAEVE